MSKKNNQKCKDSCEIIYESETPKETNKKCNRGKNIKPGDIKGKLEVTDTRKRKDGPGGN